MKSKNIEMIITAIKAFTTRVPDLKYWGSTPLGGSSTLILRHWGWLCRCKKLTRRAKPYIFRGTATCIFCLPSAWGMCAGWGLPIIGLYNTVHYCNLHQINVTLGVFTPRGSVEDSAGPGPEFFFFGTLGFMDLALEEVRKVRTSGSWNFL